MLLSHHVFQSFCIIGGTIAVVLAMVRISMPRVSKVVAAKPSMTQPQPCLRSSVEEIGKYLRSELAGAVRRNQGVNTNFQNEVIRGIEFRSVSWGMEGPYTIDVGIPCSSALSDAQSWNGIDSGRAIFRIALHRDKSEGDIILTIQYPKGDPCSYRIYDLPMGNGNHCGDGLKDIRDNLCAYLEGYCWEYA